jgi:phosphoglycerate dehydrogenase-like enzyme
MPDKSNAVSPFSKKISESTVGIIGFGFIARNIYQLLMGFDCKFKVFTKSGKISDEYYNKVRCFLINDFAKEASDIDFLFVVIPLTDETKGLVDYKFFSAMATNSILINISRGEVINEADLFNSLFNKQIGGAAIDTWYNYPTSLTPNISPSLKFPFQNIENILLSPHRSGYIDSGFPHLDDAIENLNRVKAGLDPINIVSLTKKY